VPGSILTIGADACSMPLSSSIFFAIVFSFGDIALEFVLERVHASGVVGPFPPLVDVPFAPVGVVPLCSFACVAVVAAVRRYAAPGPLILQCVYANHQYR
jgi:hypothetical protein